MLHRHNKYRNTTLHSSPHALCAFPVLGKEMGAKRWYTMARSGLLCQPRHATSRQWRLQRLCPQEEQQGRGQNAGTIPKDRDIRTIIRFTIAITGAAAASGVIGLRVLRPSGLLQTDSPGRRNAHHNPHMMPSFSRTGTSKAAQY